MTTEEMKQTVIFMAYAGNDLKVEIFRGMTDSEMIKQRELYDAQNWDINHIIRIPDGLSIHHFTPNIDADWNLDTPSAFPNEPDSF